MPNNWPQKNLWALSCQGKSKCQEKKYYIMSQLTRKNSIKAMGQVFSVFSFVFDNWYMLPTIVCKVHLDILKNQTRTNRN